MYKRKPIRLIALLMAVCMLLSVLPGSGLRTEAAKADAKQPESTSSAEVQLSAATQTLSEDCKILNYVHAEVFGSANHVARLASEETLSSYVFLNADGTRTAYYLDEAVKFVDADGKVQEKDLTLVPTVGGYTTEKNDIGLSIPTNPASGVTLLWNNTAVRIIPQGGTVGETVVEDNTVRYVDYYGSGMDLVYTPTLSGLKEDIVLESYVGQNSFTFMLNTGGLNLYSANGRYYLAASKTAVDRIDLGDVVTFDAKGRFSVGSMTAQTVMAGQIYRLTLTVDEAFLTDPSTVYPVSIDPTLTVSDNTHGAGAIEDVSIYQGRPTTNGNWTYLHSGYYDNNYTVSRTLIRLPGLTSNSIYQGVTANQILTAEFHIWEASGTTAANVSLKANTGSSVWTESGATWYNAGVTLGATYDTRSIGINAKATFDITQLVKDWKTGVQNAQKGFVLQSSNETSLDKAFYSSEHSNTDRRPYVEVNYITTNNTIGIVNTTLTLNEGTTGIISKQSVPSGLGVEWTSSNTAVATVSEDGVVTAKKAGVVTITASATGADSQTCTVYVTIPDGVYYLEHTDSECFLYGGGANISNLNNVQIATKKITSPDKLSQMWKVKYLGSGYYSIRPMHKLDLGLYADAGNGNGVRLWSIGTTDLVSSVPLYARWSVTYNMTGYVLKNMNENDRVLVPQNNSLANGTAAAFTDYSSADTCQRWRFNTISNPPEGILFYDLLTGRAEASPARHVASGQSKTLSDIYLGVAVYSCDFIDQSVEWSSSNGAAVSVNGSSGNITGGTTSGASVINVTSRTKPTVSNSYTAYNVSTVYTYHNYYDPESFDSSQRALIDDAILFADKVFYDYFSIALRMGGDAQEETITLLRECNSSLDEACNSVDGCGDCNGRHHKDTYNISTQMCENFNSAFAFRVLWCNRPDDTFCDSNDANHESELHAKGDPLAIVYDFRPAIHILNLSSQYSTRQKAHMSLLLAHETMHCFGFEDVYDETLDSEDAPDVNKHDPDNKWICLMDYFYADNGAAVQFYEDILVGVRDVFCDDCEDLAKIVVASKVEHDIINNE